MRRRETIGAAYTKRAEPRHMKAIYASLSCGAERRLRSGRSRGVVEYHPTRNLGIAPMSSYCEPRIPQGGSSLRTSFEQRHQPRDNGRLRPSGVIVGGFGMTSRKGGNRNGDAPPTAAVRILRWTSNNFGYPNGCPIISGVMQSREPVVSNLKRLRS